MAGSSGEFAGHPVLYSTSFWYARSSATYIFIFSSDRQDMPAGDRLSGLLPPLEHESNHRILPYLLARYMYHAIPAASVAESRC